MTSEPYSDGDPVAWTAIAQDEDVFAADGEPVGRVEEVLGSEDESIFHGIVVRAQASERAVEIPADQVATITNSRVTLSLDTASFESLPDYIEEPSFKIGVRGLFRRRMGWVPEEKG